MAEGHETPSVLLVDDSRLDVKIFERAAQSVALRARIEVASDGLEALDRLRRLQRGQDPGPRPALIVLDLNMPNMTGFELLEAMRKDETLRDHLVFVMTTSAASADVQRAYELNVAGYMTKTSDFRDFRPKLKLLNDFLAQVDLPHQSQSARV